MMRQGGIVWCSSDILIRPVKLLRRVSSKKCPQELAGAGALGLRWYMPRLPSSLAGGI